MEDIIIRYLHFVGIIILSGALTSEHVLLARASELNPGQLKRLVIIDAVFGASAVLVLICGLAMWFWVGKPAAFYSTNPVFHTKVLLFVIVAVISIYPTVFFLKHRKATGSVAVPKAIIMCVRAELLLLLVIPLLAVIMARNA